MSQWSHLLIQIELGLKLVVLLDKIFVFRDFWGACLRLVWKFEHKPFCISSSGTKLTLDSLPSMTNVQISFD